MQRLVRRLSRLLLSLEQRHRSLADLARLDERMLRDIGVRPAERDAAIRRLRGIL
jgi:uncharacterized protein YjiS (DUF1127 family)